MEPVKRVLRLLYHLIKLIPPLLTTTSTRLLTLPYYRLYHFNTRSPIQKLALLASASPPDTQRLLATLLSWRARKIAELQFTTVACTLLASAVISAFTWPSLPPSYFLAPSLWYTCLLLSILGILLSASSIMVLYTLGPTLPPQNLPSQNISSQNPSSQNFTSQNALTPQQADRILNRYKPLLLTEKNGTWVPRRKMVFTWQAPVMFMAYAVCGFLGGLTVLVCTPLIEWGGGWGEGETVAVIYLAVFAVAGTVFVFCSFWVYHYVEEGDEEEVDVHGVGDHLGVGGWLGPLGGGAASNGGVQYRQRGGSEAAVLAEAKERAHMEGRVF